MSYKSIEKFIFIEGKIKQWKKFQVKNFQLWIAGINKQEKFEKIKKNLNENIKGFNWVSFNASSDINLRRELPKDGPVNVGLPEMDSYNDVEEEVIKLNNNFRNWVFSLKNEKHQQFYSRLEDLTKKRDVDEKN